ncbi:MAG: TetR/AcrR family transcriptional regulator [Actinomycetota bacterium]|nr:TetR/AcrR family transcriptional regulator [Actinomycetota bacterium]
MSSRYELTGRTNQKRRTRDALISAARELLAAGESPTVEQVADRAAVSRTTAYRYFTNQRELIVAVYPQIEAPSLIDGDTSGDPLARLDIALAHLTDQLLTHEPELRAQLRLSLEADHSAENLPLRQGRAIGWFEDALAPARDRLGAKEIHRLALAIRATCGIEALVWLTDVGGLTRKQAAELMRRSARTIAAAALDAPQRE